MKKIPWSLSILIGFGVAGIVILVLYIVGNESPPLALNYRRAKK